MELPAFCRVQITVSPAIKMEVWMPASNWNGNFEACRQRREGRLYQLPCNGHRSESRLCNC